jgi:hypothetical protein
MAVLSREIPSVFREKNFQIGVSQQNVREKIEKDDQATVVDLPDNRPIPRMLPI